MGISLRIIYQNLASDKFIEVLGAPYLDEIKNKKSKIDDKIKNILSLKENKKYILILLSQFERINIIKASFENN